ncbi:hypothetical protein WEI85_00765 [Actinomycetes bacterium KLBMP 9797]
MDRYRVPGDPCRYRYGAEARCGTAAVRRYRYRTAHRYNPSGPANRIMRTGTAVYRYRYRRGRRGTPTGVPVTDRPSGHGE